MPSDHDEVPAGAVIAAMELVKGLGDDENAMPGDQLLGLIRDIGVTPEELTQGFALLISSFMGLVDGPLDLVPPITRKLRALELVPDRVLPTMAGALTAAALGQSPWQWRHSVGVIIPNAEHWEGPAWAYTTWLLADFLDFAAEEHGATAKLTDSLFARLLRGMLTMRAGVDPLRRIDQREINPRRLASPTYSR
jgi:hypothetical protein